MLELLQWSRSFCTSQAAGLHLPAKQMDYFLHADPLYMTNSCPVMNHPIWDPLSGTFNAEKYSKTLIKLPGRIALVHLKSILLKLVLPTPKLCHVTEITSNAADYPFLKCVWQSAGLTAGAQHNISQINK